MASTDIGAAGGLFRTIDNRIAALQPVLSALGLLALRLPVAAVFWSSGRTKVDGWNIFVVNDTQYFLFEHEFGLPFPVLMAHLTAIAEHVLPILLVLGLLTRLGALGMLVMTMVIQLFVFPDAWFNAHMFWAAILFAVLALGPGKLSLDHLIASRLRG
ncbi:MAG: DoxX family protein [Alphaproteobacteria bacterium]